jgi:hypothetical protein
MWSCCPVAVHQSLMSFSLAFCFPFSSRETFDSCQPSARASARPLANPASLRKPRSRAPSACRASCAWLLTDGSGLVLGVWDGGGPEKVTHADAVGHDVRILEDFRARHSALRVEVADGEKTIVVQPPVVSVDRKGHLLRQLVPRKPSDVLAGFQVEVGQ